MGRRNDKNLHTHTDGQGWGKERNKHTFYVLLTQSIKDISRSSSLPDISSGNHRNHSKFRISSTLHLYALQGSLENVVGGETNKASACSIIHLLSNLSQAGIMSPMEPGQGLRD